MKERSANNQRLQIRSGVSIVIVYEILAARERAAGFYEEFSSRSPDIGDASVNWYSFEDLGVSLGTERAMRTAVEAEVVAFAINGTGDLPASIKLWTENWRVRRGNRGGLLVGLVSIENELRGVAGFKEIYLRHLAHRADMDYLSHFPSGLRKTLPDSIDSFNQRADRVTPILEEILHARSEIHHLSLK